MFRFGLENLKFRKITFFYYSLISIFSVPSRLVQENSSYSDILLGLFVGAVITFITLPVLWVICYFNQQFSLGKRSFFIPLTLIALAGAARGGILHLLIEQFSLTDNLRPSLAVLSSTLFTAIYFIAISSFIETVLQRRERFQRVFAEASLLLANQGAEIEKKVDPEEVYRETLLGLKSGVSSLGLDSERLNPQTLLQASRVIQEQINEVLRPLSHRLWVNGMGQIKHRHLFGILKDAIANLDFSVKYILIYQFFIGGYGIALVLGFQRSLYLTSLGVITSILVIFIFSRVRRRSNHHPFLIGVVFLFCEGVLPVTIPLLFSMLLNDSINVIGGLIISPTIPILILLVSAYRLVTRDRELAIGAATSVGFQIVSITSRGNSERDGIELAKYFHNSLQSELFGIAKRLEAASNIENQQGASEAISNLNSILNRDFKEIQLSEMNGIMRIEKLISSWQGIADIDVKGLESLAEEAELAKRTSQIIEEMITNSIRYGGADKINVELNLTAANLEIEVSHNGKGEISRKSGLGSLLLTYQSTNGMEIQSELGKTFIRLSIPTNL